MKKLFFPLLAGLGIVCFIRPEARAQKQEYKEHISKTFTLQKTAGSVFALYNLNGSLDIEGYSGDKVLVEIEERLIADNPEALETAKKEFKLGIDQTTDSITVYIAKPFDSRPCRDCNRWENRKIDYEYVLIFNVKVPYSMSLDVSTINNGDITVNNVSGALRVDNINGRITIGGAKGDTWAHTINGDVTINYLSAPTGDSDYYTLNGTLSVSYPAALSADLQFKSMSGSFYTDFPAWQVLPMKVKKSVRKNGAGTEYKMEVDKQIRIGDGGRVFKFETMNGNIYIKRQA